MGSREEWQYTLTIELPDGYPVSKAAYLGLAISEAMRRECADAGVRFEGLKWIVGGAQEPGGGH